MKTYLLLVSLALCGVLAGSPSTLYTYTLSESTGGFLLWTTTTIRKVLAGDANPVASASGINMAAAKGEWESFQIIVSPGAPADPVVDWTLFPSLSSTAQAWQAFRALYIPGLAGGIFPEELVPVTKATAVPRQTGNTIIWFNFYVPRDAPAGEHVTSLTVGGITIHP